MSQSMYVKIKEEAEQRARDFILNYVRNVKDSSHLFTLEHFIRLNLVEANESKTSAPEPNLETESNPETADLGSERALPTMSKKEAVIRVLQNGPLPVSKLAQEAYGANTAHTRKSANSLLHWLKGENIVGQHEMGWTLISLPKTQKGPAPGTLGAAALAHLKSSGGRCSRTKLRRTLHNNNPEVSRAAVYAALKRLEDSGIVRSIDDPSGEVVLVMN